MTNTRSRGFTLIELLVVIAIIGILSAVVLASLSTARNKGNDAAVQSNLSTIQTQAEIYYGSNTNQYNTTATAVTSSTCGSVTGTLFSDSNILAALNSAKNSAKNGSVYCGSAANTATQAYTVEMLLNGTTTNPTEWCIDSTGVAKYEYQATMPSTGYACS